MRPGGTSSPRVRAALALLGFVLFPAIAQAQSSPPVVYPHPEPAPVSYKRAYIAFGVGGALTLSSFLIQQSADRAYERYETGTDPVQIGEDFAQAERLDKWSAVTLLAGTGALALGVYWRFIKRPPSRSGATLELEPSLSPTHAGLALALRFP
jgi:hypothetical protein